MVGRAIAYKGGPIRVNSQAPPALLPNAPVKSSGAHVLRNLPDPQDHRAISESFVTGSLLFRHFPVWRQVSISGCPLKTRWAMPSIQ